MKNFIPQKLIFSLIVSFVFSNNLIFAQEPDAPVLSKDELKLIKLEEKVKSIEAKIEATEIKIAQADSLIQAGFEMANEASTELKVISGEEKIFLKDNDTQRKALLKQLKKADDEDAKSIEAELKTLESSYKAETKAFEKRYSLEEKKLTKAKSNDDKGKEKLKQYNPKLKDYQKALEIAKEQLEEFKTEKDM